MHIQGCIRIIYTFIIGSLVTVEEVKFRFLKIFFCEQRKYLAQWAKFSIYFRGYALCFQFSAALKLWHDKKICDTNV